jgi:hypothetical protein
MKINDYAFFFWIINLKFLFENNHRSLFNLWIGQQTGSRGTLILSQVLLWYGVIEDKWQFGIHASCFHLLCHLSAQKMHNFTFIHQNTLLRFAFMC